MMTLFSKVSTNWRQLILVIWLSFCFMFGGYIAFHNCGAMANGQIEAASEMTDEMWDLQTIVPGADEL